MVFLEDHLLRFLLLPTKKLGKIQIVLRTPKNVKAVLLNFPDFWTFSAVFESLDWSSSVMSSGRQGLRGSDDDGSSLESLCNGSVFEEAIAVVFTYLKQWAWEQIGKRYRVSSPPSEDGFVWPTHLWESGSLYFMHREGFWFGVAFSFHSGHHTQAFVSWKCCEAFKVKSLKGRWNTKTVQVSVSKCTLLLRDNIANVTAFVCSRLLLAAMLLASNATLTLVEKSSDKEYNIYNLTHAYMKSENTKDKLYICDDLFK